MKFSLFIREQGKLRLNPHIIAGKLEICLDEDGWLIVWRAKYYRGEWKGN